MLRKSLWNLVFLLRVGFKSDSKEKTSRTKNGFNHLPLQFVTTNSHKKTHLTKISNKKNIPHQTNLMRDVFKKNLF